MSEYDPDSGAEIKADFIGGLNLPYGLAVSGGILFASNYGANFVSKFDANTGAAINRAFVMKPEFNHPIGLGVVNFFLYVVWAERRQGSISIYNFTTGEFVKDLKTGLDEPYGLAVTPSEVFVSLVTPRLRCQIRPPGSHAVRDRGATPPTRIGVEWPI